MGIKTYNSKKALSDYKKGEVYAFYVHNTNLKKLEQADETTVSKYSSALSKFIEDNRIDINNTGKYLNMTRVIGVVVDKFKAIGSNDIDKITVMFKTVDNKYLLNKYATGYCDVFTNDKKHVLPATMLNASIV